MWAVQHSSTPSRVSAKNVDLRIAQLAEQTIEPATYPTDTEMWVGKHERSRTPSSQFSMPSLSPTSAIAHDDAASQASESNTAYSVEDRDALVEHGDDLPVQILPTDRFEPHMHDDATAEIIAGLSENLKLPPIEGYQELDSDLRTPRVHSINAAAASGLLLNEKIVNEDEMPHSTNATATETAEDDSSSSGSIPIEIETIGLLREQLQAVISKISVLEYNQPTVMAADYADLQQRMTKLEAEKAGLSDRHEALFAIRDEDVANLVKLRGLLAKERREHEAICKLRDEDLQNVIALRNKLAQNTWANVSQSSSSSPSSSRRQTRMEKAQSISQSNELWHTAKTAALEQRLLELESANADLREKLEYANSQLQLQHQHPIHPAKQQHQEQQAIPSVAKSEQDEGAVAAAAATNEQQRGLEALFELSLRQRERYCREVEQLQTENEDLRVRLGEKDYQLEGFKVLLESRYGMR